MKHYSYRWAVLILSVLLVTSCTAILLGSLIDGSNGGGKVNGQASYMYDDDPSSRLLLNGVNESGDAITVYGEKTAKGLPTAVTGFDITPWGDQAPTAYTVKNNQVTTVVAPNGVIMQLDWQSAKSVVVSLTDPNTHEQITTLVGEDSKASQADGFSGEITRLSPEQGDLVLSAEPGRSAQVFIGQEPDTKKQTSDAKGLLYLDICGKDCDSMCWADVYLAKSDYPIKDYYVRSFPAKRLKTGKYEYTLPAGTMPHHEIKPTEWVNTLATVMGYICTGLSTGVSGTFQIDKNTFVQMEYFSNVLCPSLATTIAGLGGGTTTPAAAAFLGACTAAVKGISIYCSTVAAGAPGDVSVPDLVKLVNEGLISNLDIEWDTPLFVVPCASGWTNDVIKAKTLTYKGGATLPDSRISLSMDPGIYGITTNPAAPGRGQTYRILVDVECAPKGAKLTIEVQGSDNYHNKGSYTFTEATESKKIHMDVPGAESGVKDWITATLTLPEGKEITRVAYLVFGK